jgi:hypothetical protein
MAEIAAGGAVNERQHGESDPDLAALPNPDSTETAICDTDDASDGVAVAPQANLTEGDGPRAESAGASHHDARAQGGGDGAFARLRSALAWISGSCVSAAASCWCLDWLGDTVGTSREGAALIALCAPWDKWDFEPHCVATRLCMRRDVPLMRWLARNGFVGGLDKGVLLQAALACSATEIVLWALDELPQRWPAQPWPRQAGSSRGRATTPNHHNRRTVSWEQACRFLLECQGAKAALEMQRRDCRYPCRDLATKKCFSACHVQASGMPHC